MTIPPTLPVTLSRHARPCVTEKQCADRRASIRWVIVFLGTFFLALLAGVAGANYAATEAQAQSERNTARIDSLEQHIKDRLDDIWNYIRDERTLER